MKNTILVAGIALVAGFLIGFIPQYARSHRLDNQLGEARLVNAGGQLRDLAGLTYVEANQKNYGLAAGTSSRLFARAREVANEVPDPSEKKAIEDLQSFRDRITAALAKGDAGVMGDLQELFDRTRRATQGHGEQ